jgi:hypothetical protein
MSGWRRDRAGGGILAAVLLSAVSACSGGGPGAATGTAGTGGGPCPAPPASLDCPAGAGDHACGIPEDGAKLTRFGDQVTLEVREPSGSGRVLRVTTGGLTPLLTLKADEFLALLDGGYAYVSKPKDGKVDRRKLDADPADSAEPFLSCAGGFSGAFFTDEKAIYLNSTIGLLRIDRASTPDANLARLHPWGYQFTWFDGAHFYGTPVTHFGADLGSNRGGPIIVGESSGAACTCDCSQPGAADLATCTADPTGTCGRTPSALASTSDLVYPVVRGADATSLFVTTWPPLTGVAGGLFRVAKDGSKRVTLLGPGSSHATWSPGDALAVDGGFIYARVATPAGFRSIRMTTDGADVTELGSSVSDHAGRALAIQVDAEGAYFLLDDGCTARLVRYAKPAAASDGGTDAGGDEDASGE